MMSSPDELFLFRKTFQLFLSLFSFVYFMNKLVRICFESEHYEFGWRLVFLERSIVSIVRHHRQNQPTRLFGMLYRRGELFCIKFQYVIL